MVIEGEVNAKRSHKDNLCKAEMVQEQFTLRKERLRLSLTGNDSLGLEAILKSVLQCVLIPIPPAMFKRGKASN